MISAHDLDGPAAEMKYFLVTLYMVSYVYEGGRGDGHSKGTLEQGFPSDVAWNICPSQHPVGEKGLGQKNCGNIIYHAPSEIPDVHAYLTYPETPQRQFLRCSLVEH